MTSRSPRPRRGFMANLQASMTPTSLPEDDGSPIVAPRSVRIAFVLLLIAGVVYGFFGLSFMTTESSTINTAKSSVASYYQKCNDPANGVGGISKSVSSSPAASATSLASICAQITAPTIAESTITSYKNEVRLFGPITLIIGLAAAISSWWVRQGARWARRVVIAATVLTLLLTVLVGLSSSLTLLASLLLVIGMALTFVGKGSQFFALVARRRAQHD